MSNQEDLQVAFREKADDLLRQLPSAERETLLIKCWMSHDARWFMAVAREYGVQTANRLNQIAAREVGKVEAQRIMRALHLPPAANADDCLQAQEAFISLLGPDLLDYRAVKIGDQAYQMQIRRCFAYDNAARAGIADEYECGIFARVAGWLDALGVKHELRPSLGKCLKSQGRECAYTIMLPDRG